MMKKPEGPDSLSQTVASGAVEPRTTDVEVEVAQMGINVNAPVSGPNDNQGGN
jgi:hypothetical protein